MQLTAAGAVFKDAPTIVSEIMTAFEKPVASMRARIKQLLALADQRQVCRAEIAHYRYVLDITAAAVAAALVCLHLRTRMVAARALTAAGRKLRAWQTMAWRM